MTREQAESLQTFGRRNGVTVAIAKPWGTTAYAVTIIGGETFYSHDTARDLIAAQIDSDNADRGERATFPAYDC